MKQQPVVGCKTSCPSAVPVRIVSFLRCLMLCLIVCAGAGISGCSRHGGEISLDESEPLALAPDVTWAVVIDPYAAYRKDTSWQADAAGHCRKGDILQVEGKTVLDDGNSQDGNGQTWYKFKGGWLPSSAVSIFRSEERRVGKECRSRWSPY